MGYKIDFHTHSVASPDGSLSPDDYRRMLESGKLDCIAVTDHNTTEMALRLRGEFGDRIIVGEEINTRSGEIVGLFLTEAIPPMLTAKETIGRIRSQGGLVYVPHPFETVRKGLSPHMLDDLADAVDIIETCNGRALSGRQGRRALAWAKRHEKPAAAGSDAHGRSGWGGTYTVVESAPVRDNLIQLLHSSSHRYHRPGALGLLYPKINRLRKRFNHA